MTEEVNGVIRQYHSWVKSLAYAFVRQLPASVEVDDLVQEGLIAVLDCWERHDPRLGASFKTFCRHRVIGAFGDYLRRIDSLGQSDRGRVRKLNQSIRDSSDHIDRGALTKALDIDFAELEELLILRNVADDSQIADDTTTGGYGDPSEHLAFQDCIASINRSIDQDADPKRARQVFQMRFMDGRELTEIAEVFGISVSRVCQIAKRLEQRVAQEMHG